MSLPDLFDVKLLKALDKIKDHQNALKWVQTGKYTMSV